ncbi:malaria antigen-related [Anaeramoeba flamelloides]|uniref:Malaria antigen-related n=1 Tax=Anaeramoeba flamelloides TaxID=1746091 RepID=A0ABQ8Y683_9EUKA|nr:malaria antigen-related [Anaeramoeba flamelloides]
MDPLLCWSKFEKELFLLSPTKIKRKPNKKLQQLVSQLKTFKFPIHRIEAGKINSAITQICLLLPHRWDNFTIIFCNFLKKSLPTEKTKLEEEEIFKILSFILSVLPKSKNKPLILTCVSLILYGNSNKCSLKLSGKIILSLTPILRVNEKQESTQQESKEERIIRTKLVALNCLRNLVFKSGKKLRSFFKKIFKMIFDNLEFYTRKSEASFFRMKIFINLTKCLIVYLNESNYIPDLKKKILLSIIRRLIFYNTFFTLKITNDKTQTNINPNLDKNSNTKIKSTESNKQGKSQKETINNSKIVQPTKNEIAFDENSNKISIKNIIQKIKLNSLHCLQSISKIIGKDIHGYWYFFFPDSVLLNRKNPSLFTLLLYDNSTKVRESAASAIGSLLIGSKRYLSVADDNSKRYKSYTPLTITLAKMIKEMHKAFLTFFNSETENNVIVQALKTFSILINNVTYENLSPGYLTSIINILEKFILNPETHPQILKNSILTFGCIFGTGLRIQEVSQYLQSAIINLKTSKKKNKSSLLFKKLLKLLRFKQLTKKRKQNKSIDQNEKETKKDKVQEKRKEKEKLVTINKKNNSYRSEVLFTFTKISITYCWAIDYLWPELSKIISTILKKPKLVENDLIIIINSIKLVKEFIFSIGSMRNSNPKSMICKNYNNKSFSKSHIKEIWINLLENHLPIAFHFPNSYLVREVAVSIFGYFTPQIFEMLSEKRRLVCITLTFGATDDKNNLVRAAACKTLGIYTLFERNREDSIFMSDTAKILIKSLTDKNLRVRVMASWSLGNLCDALFLDLELKEKKKHQLFLRKKKKTINQKVLENETGQEQDKRQEQEQEKNLKQGKEQLQGQINGKGNGNGNDKQKDIVIEIDMQTEIEMEKMNQEQLNPIINELELSLLCKIAKVCLNAMANNKKIQANVARTLGNLCRVATSEFLFFNNNKILNEIANSLLQTITKIKEKGLFKVIWNSCYAIGNLFRNPHLESKLSHFEWVPKLINSLLKITICEANYKIRINAVFALIQVPNIQCFGENDLNLANPLKVALTALEELFSGNPKHSKNIKYQNSYQISLSQHLTKFLIKIFDWAFRDTFKINDKFIELISKNKELISFIIPIENRNKKLIPLLTIEEEENDDLIESNEINNK